MLYRVVVKIKYIHTSNHLKQCLHVVSFNRYQLLDIVIFIISIIVSNPNTFLTLSDFTGPRITSPSNPSDLGLERPLYPHILFSLVILFGS